jgi:hypothetical protein
MLVKCIVDDVLDIKDAIQKEKLQKYLHKSGRYETLEVNREYVVQAIERWDFHDDCHDDCWYYYLHTINSHHYPRPYPVEFFIILDNTLPIGWKVKFITREGMLKMERLSFPEWADDNTFFEKLLEYDDPDAMLAYITNLEQTRYPSKDGQSLKYSPRIFGCQLAKKLLEEPFECSKVAKWSEQLYREKQSECDDLLGHIICRLSIIDNPELAYSKERLQDIADGLIHASRVVDPERTVFSVNDEVTIKKTAPAAYRPGRQGSLCWIQAIESEENAALFGHNIGSEIYFVRFQDSEVLEIPKEFLIRHDLLKK